MRGQGRGLDVFLPRRHRDGCGGHHHPRCLGVQQHTHAARVVVHAREHQGGHLVHRVSRLDGLDVHRGACRLQLCQAARLVLPRGHVCQSPTQRLLGVAPPLVPTESDVAPLLRPAHALIVEPEAIGIDGALVTPESPQDLDGLSVGEVDDGAPHIQPRDWWSRILLGRARLQHESALHEVRGPRHRQRGFVVAGRHVWVHPVHHLARPAAPQVFLRLRALVTLRPHNRLGQQQLQRTGKVLHHE
mmetsp:Transcript_34276/g.79207  ORF Transcript_34276/g.79207 Transcript_34276/m.79207 type:complete len:245 (-) Transcript_34276:629-1363(-)